MNPKLRIKLIRLLDKLEEQPEYAARIGIAGATTKVRPVHGGRSKCHS